MVEMEPRSYCFINSIKDWRSLADYEVALERKEGSKLIGPRASDVQATSQLSLAETLSSARPILSSRLGKVDALIAKAYRAVLYSIKNSPIGMAASLGLLYHSGIELGKNIFKEYTPTTLEDISHLLEDLGWCLVDLMPNGNIRVYECIDCSGLPYLGFPVCTFESGILSSLLSLMNDANIKVEEIRCWATGYSFCEFKPIKL